MHSSPAHQCMIYTGSPSRHMPGLAKLAKQRLRENWRCLYLNSPALVTQMRATLAGAGIAVEDEIARGALVLSSDQSQIRDGNFDMDGMLESLRAAIADAVNEGFTGLWATGDMSWEFGPERNFSKLLQYEFELERLFQEQPSFSGICQYHAETLPADVVQWGLRTHRAVYINESSSQTNPYYAPQNLLTYKPFVSRTELQGMFAQPLSA